MKKFLLGVLVTLLYPLCAQEPWTWLFTKEFTKKEVSLDKELLLYSKHGLPSFTQLIFSWNALKPKKGFFSFFVQVNDAKTNNWQEWHHMADWGNDIQKSYYSQGKDGTTYHYVRLEIPADKYATAYRIKIVAQDHASLSLLRSININIANLQKFKTEKMHTAIAQLPSIFLRHIPLQSQMILDHPKANCLCSPTSCSMVVAYLNRQFINPIQFANNVFDNGLGIYGSWPFNTAQAFLQTQGKFLFAVARLNSFIDLYKQLQKKLPVIVSVRGQLQGAPKDYSNGHLLVVVGWDQQKRKVLCHDPAFDTNDKVLVGYDFDAFAAAWGKSCHLAYIVQRRS